MPVSAGQEIDEKTEICDLARIPMISPEADHLVLYVLAGKSAFDLLTEMALGTLRLSVWRWQEAREILARSRPSDGEQEAKMLPSTPVPLKTCSVTVTDSAGVRHSVEVIAESLFEAAAMGLAALKKDGWTAPIGPAARLEVEVRETVVRHTLTVVQIERWLQGATASPNERVKKDRLRALLST
jgi:hypothetical protein